MEQEEALHRIRRFGALGRFRFTHDSSRHMREHAIVTANVRRALAEASLVEESRGERSSDWTVVGPGFDGDELEVGAVFDGDLVVITLSWR